MKFCFITLACLGLTSLGADSPADESEWFRRDHGLVEPGQMLPGDLSRDARLLWRVPVDRGISTPCVFGDSIYLTTYREAEKELATVALDRTTGQQRWRNVVPTKQLELFHVTGSPAASSPACNGRQVFAFFGSYGLLCYDLDGKLLWEHRLGPFQDEFGATSSPVLVDDKVILNEDHDIDSFLIALNQATGEVVWKTPRENATRSYSTPLVLRTAEGPGQPETTQIIVAGALQLSAYDPSTGKKLWWYDGLSRIVDSTPVVANGLIYVATWTPGGDPGERIAMEPFAEALKTWDKNADGEVGEQELPADSEVVPRFFRMDLNQDHKLNQREWEQHASVFERAQNVAVAIQPGSQAGQAGPLPAGHARWVFGRGLPTVPSSVVYDGVLYMVKDSGIITSLDAATGKLLKQGRSEGRGNYYASLIAGDGKVWMISESGVLTVLKAGREWEILSSHDFGERILATPVVRDGQVLIRTDDALHCFVPAG